MNSLNINTKKVDSCMAESYKRVDKKIVDNKLLADDRKWALKLGIVLHPAISINNITYRGDINGYDVFKAICAGF
jgi:hypothetical protein